MKALRIVAVLVLVAAAFAGGYVYKAVKSVGPTAARDSGRKVLYWQDPMHPAYKSDRPGIAPDCGMTLEPVYADSKGAAAAEQASDAPAMPMGTIQITPETQQLIGVKYGRAEDQRGSRTIRAVGRVAFDETRIQHIHTKLEGWIDKVFVDYTGQLVAKGQPLMTIYSPDMLASQRELLLAAKATGIMRTNPLPVAFDQSESLLQAARRRLELWDLSEAQINQVLRTGQPIKNVTLYSPIAGYVTDRKAFPQLKAMPDTDLYTIVDLKTVWIMADVFEYEAPDIHVGETARVSLQSAPGKSFHARIDYIQPEVDPTTRTLKLRLEMDNPKLALKPDMYADVELRVNLPSMLTVSADAVLDAGEHKTVFVDRGNGFLEPRRVTTGQRAGDRIQILSGIQPGERVVTSGNFLIDSESHLKAASSGMGGMPGMPSEPGKGAREQSGRSEEKGMVDMPRMSGAPAAAGNKPSAQQ